MSKTNDCPVCIEKVDKLIANEQTKFVEADREWLLTQDEAQLDKLVPNEVEPVEVEKIVEKKVEANALSDEDKAALAYGRKQLAERKASMIKGIQDNTEDVWTEEALLAMDEGTLENVYKSVKKKEDDVTDYSLQGTPPVNNKAGNVEPLLPAGIEVNETK